MMGKRSRDNSFSPSPTASPSSSPSNLVPELDPGPPPKHTLVDHRPPVEIMQCTLPPHREARSFTSIGDFEVHYTKDHTNRCASCSRNFPTAHFLGLHIEELHDPFRAHREAKGEKTYGCFVEGCDKKCSSPAKRRLHLIDKHMFPKTYNFRVIENGIDRSTSMLNEGHRGRISTTSRQDGFRGDRRRSSTTAGSSANSISILTPSSSQDAESEKADEPGPKPARPRLPKDVIVRNADNEAHDGVGDLEKSMAALRFVPPSVLARQKRNPGD